MAEGRQLSFVSSFKEQFDDQLTCSVCLDQYTNPKTLPCHHSFCLRCVERLPITAVEIIKNGRYCICCPTCRVDHLLPHGGANSLPSAFHINSLLDLRKSLEITKAVSPARSTCPKHNDILTVYCETCCQVICRDCTISTGHNKHTFHLISECYPKHHQQIQGNLELVKHKLDDMNTAMTGLDTREKEVFEQGENIKEQINTHAQQLIDNIQQSRTHLTQQLDTIVQLKRQTLATQRQQAQKLHTQLKTCQDMIERSLKEWNQQQILAQKITMMHEMKTAVQNVDPAVFQPIEYANLQYDKMEKEMGSVSRQKNWDRKISLKVSPCIAKRPSTATLTLHSQDGSSFSLPPSLISSTLSSPGNEHSEKCTITQKQLEPGKYNITFTPSTTDDQLIVQVGGVDVPDSPFTLPVIPTPEMRGKPVNIITGLKEPYGIAVCDNGDIVVAESGANCIIILNKIGGIIKVFGRFRCPHGVAISKDCHILVTDDHRLQKLTTDGVCVKSVGSSKCGSVQLKLYYPRGIAVHPITGQIFVADCYNNRIQVFSNALTFSHTITPRFSLISPKFRDPLDIAVDNEGYLYVVDDGNRCIFKITSDEGKVIKTYGSTPDGKVINPSAVTILDNLLYVCDYDDHCVSVFDFDGRFQHKLRDLPCPSSITADKIGNLYVSDLVCNGIITF